MDGKVTVVENILHFSSFFRRFSLNIFFCNLLCSSSTTFRHLCQMKRLIAHKLGVQKEDSFVSRVGLNVNLGCFEYGLYFEFLKFGFVFFLL